MRDAFSAEHIAEKLRRLNGNCSHQHRLLSGVCFFDGFHHCIELLFLCHINGIVLVHSAHRLIGGNFHHVHAVDIPEFFFFCQRSTCHPRLLFVLIKEVLERDSGQSLALPLHLNFFLGFNSLVQTVRIPPAGHDTPCKFIHNEYFVVFYHIILISVHQIVGPQRQNNIVLDLQIFRVREIFNGEKFLHFFHTVLCQSNNLILLIDNEVPGLYDFFAHDSRHLSHLAAGFPPLQLPGQSIAKFIELCRLAALSGNNQRSTGLVDEHRVHLVDDSIIQLPLYQLFFIDHHVIPQIIKSQLVVGNISDVAGVLLPPLIVVHGI